MWFFYWIRSFPLDFLSNQTGHDFKLRKIKRERERERERERDKSINAETILNQSQEKE